MAWARGFGRPEPSDWPALGYFAVAVLRCLRFDPAGAPFIGDNQHYFFIAERFAAGIAPHQAHFDPKTALSVMLSGAAMLAGRGAGMDEVAAARAASILAAGASVAAVWCLARRVTRSRLGAHVAALLVLMPERLYGMAATGARPKVFVLPFILYALLAAARQRPLAVGVGSGLAFLTWQPALLAIGAAIEPVARSRSRVGAIARVCIGAGAVIVAYELYFAWRGALADQIEQSVLFPLQYMGHSWRLGATATHARWLFALGRTPSLDTVLPWGFLGALSAGLLCATLRPRWAVEQLLAVQGRPAYVVVGLLTFVWTLFDYQGFPDRFPLLPVGAVAVGWAVAAGTAMAARRWHRRIAVAGGAAVLVALASGVALQIRSTQPRSRGLNAQRKEAAAVTEWLEAGLSVYAHGCVHLLALAHANNYVRYGFMLRGLPEYWRDTFSARGFAPRREGKLPDVVLWCRGKERYAEPWLERFYRRAGRPYFGKGESVWISKRLTRRLRRHGCGQGGDVSRDCLLAENWQPLAAR
ncbi:MAG: hypothetical protein D6815_12525 [Candidatus Dadabacteria bacterium]|nr:MAG: hypothetical protein D6815_12525 [Candidatus Dadabacteria bacterium]